MPVYEYKCRECGRTFDIKAEIRDTGVKAECPVCGSSNTGRVFSVFSRTVSGSVCAPSPRRFG